MLMSKAKQQPKQNHKTKQYWDGFYSKLPNHPITPEDDTSSRFEWIVANSYPLLDEILEKFPEFSDNSLNSKIRLEVLEIGCGVSELSRCLLERLIENRSSFHQRVSFGFDATDISEVCIDQCHQRDQTFIDSLQDSSNDSLQYKTLDILTTEPTQQYDVILDKGTLDTFLFRSKRTNKGSEPYPPLLLPLLNNIHGWLKNGGRYLIISPRGRIKAVRDYIGFQSVRRVAFNLDNLGGAVLMKSNADSTTKNEVYIYECVRNDDYNPQSDEPFRSTAKAVDDQSACAKCQQTFKEFRGKVEVEHQGKIVWERKWNNHVLHCRGLEMTSR